MNDVHTLFGYVPEPPAEESQTALAGQTGAGDDNQPRPTTTPAPPTAEDSQPEVCKNCIKKMCFSLYILQLFPSISIKQFQSSSHVRMVLVSLKLIF